MKQTPARRFFFIIIQTPPPDEGEKEKRKSPSRQQPRTLAAVTFSPDRPRSAVNVKKPLQLVSASPKHHTPPGGCLGEEGCEGGGRCCRCHPRRPRRRPLPGQIVPEMYNLAPRSLKIIEGGGGGLARASSRLPICHLERFHGGEGGGRRDG